MAALLPSVHRWCVSGTPLDRSLEDAFGLLLFLGAAPLDSKHWWRAVVQVRAGATERWAGSA